MYESTFVFLFWALIITTMVPKEIMPVDAIKLNTIIVYITEKLVGLAKVYKKLDQIYPVHSNRGN